MGATFLALGRMILVLGLIIGTLVLLARFGHKRQQGGGLRFGAKPVGRIEVLSRRSLGRHVSLLVVRVANRTLLVGQSAQQMTLLAELDGDEWVEAASPVASLGVDSNLFRAPRTVPGTGDGSPGAWDALVDRLREMTVRH
jgi:flagellar biogenesis protein FliO